METKMKRKHKVKQNEKKKFGVLLIILIFKLLFSMYVRNLFERL